MPNILPSNNNSVYLCRTLKGERVKQRERRDVFYSIIATSKGIGSWVHIFNNGCIFLKMIINFYKCEVCLAERASAFL